MTMLETLQKDRSFYFSYSIDLTKRLQNTIEEMVNGPESEVEDLIRRFPTSINYVHKFAFNH